MRLKDLVSRKDRFTFDLRSECLVYTGIVSAYHATEDSEHFTDLPKVMAHALENDGVVGMWKDPETGRINYDSCRIFTDLENALRFARQERQKSVYNLNREEEVRVDAAHAAL